MYIQLHFSYLFNTSDSHTICIYSLFFLIMTPTSHNILDHYSIMYIKLDVPPSPYKTYDVDLPSTSQGIIYRITYTIYSQDVLPAAPPRLHTGALNRCSWRAGRESQSVPVTSNLCLTNPGLEAAVCTSLTHRPTHRDAGVWLQSLAMLTVALPP